MVSQHSSPPPPPVLRLGWGMGRRQGWQRLCSNPTCAFHRYLCCDTQMELREWFATFLSVQVPGAGAPPE